MGGERWLKWRGVRKVGQGRERGESEGSVHGR